MSGAVTKTNPVATAEAHWGADMPDWIRALAEACAETSQNKVATRIGARRASSAMSFARAIRAIWLPLRNWCEGPLWAEKCPVPASVKSRWMNAMSGVAAQRSSRPPILYGCGCTVLAPVVLVSKEKNDDRTGSLHRRRNARSFSACCAQD